MATFHQLPNALLKLFSRFGNRRCCRKPITKQGLMHLCRAMKRRALDADAPALFFSHERGAGREVQQFAHGSRHGNLALRSEFGLFLLPSDITCISRPALLWSIPGPTCKRPSKPMVLRICP